MNTINVVSNADSTYSDRPPADSGTGRRRSIWPVLAWLGFGLAALLLLLLLIGCRRPDLAVEIVELSLAQEVSCEGAAVQDRTIEVRVHNTGSRPADSFTVTLNGASQTVDGLAAGETTTLSFTIEGSEALLAAVDSENVITEDNEENNTDEVSVELLTTLLADVQCRPDLVVVADCQPTAAVPVRFRVENRGNLDVSESIEIDINGQLVSLGGLPAGGDLLFDGYESDDAAELSAVIDPNNAIDERSEDNNTVTMTVAACGSTSVPPPDLSVSLTAGWSCQNQGEIQGSLLLINSGGQASGPFTVSLTGATVADQTGLNPGETRQIQIAIPVGAEVNQTFALETIIDSADEVPEGNESNNSATTTVTVDTESCNPDVEGPMPDLTIALSAADLVIPCDGNVPTEIDVTVTITNIGVEDAGPFEVDVAGIMVPFADGLAGGDLNTITTVVPASATSVTAVVDSSNSVAEFNESNNAASADVVRVEPAGGCDTPITNLTIALGCTLDTTTNEAILAVVARNEGPGPAAAFSIAVNGSFYPQTGLAAGAESRLDLRFPYATGNFWAMVDGLNNVKETNERDNGSHLNITDPAHNHCQKSHTPAEVRLDFELGRQKVTGSPTSGTYSVYEVATNRHIASWYALRTHLDSGCLPGDVLSFNEVLVYVIFQPDFGTPVQMEIINPAGGTTHGWLQTGICHALEIQFPE